MFRETTDEDGRLDRLFAALADPTRRRLIQRLHRHPGLTTGELAAAHPRLSRWAVAKHLGVLRSAGLLRTMSSGRHRRHYAEPVALGPARRWLVEFDR